jgi:hypothetical protein
VKKPITNVAASVHARLLDRATAESRPFNELLQYYGMERFLYRLSRSSHAERFVLKGALMLRVWGGPMARATKDIDLLGHVRAEVDGLVAIVRECLAIEVEDDGIRFDTRSVSGEEIRLDAEYGGIRLRFRGALGKAKLTLQVDVGFGDVVTPRPTKLVYPSLLNFAGPRLLGYTPETVVAEKLQAMVALDMANTRLKDFLDIWTLAQGREFSGPVLASAIDATFRQRKTSTTATSPVALTPAFYAGKEKQMQWGAYLRKARITGAPALLAEVAVKIHQFAMPILAAIADGHAFSKTWQPGGPWSVR